MSVVRKRWQELSAESCPECGDYLEVLTSAPENYMYDGDLVRCDECQITGWISADEDEASVHFHDVPVEIKE